MKDLYFLFQKLIRLVPPFEKYKDRRIVDVVVENMYHKKYIIYNHSDDSLQIELSNKEDRLKN